MCGAFPDVESTLGVDRGVEDDEVQLVLEVPVA